MKAKPAQSRTVDPSPRIWDAIRDGARGLNQAGIITKQELARYESPWPPKVPSYSAAKIRALRHRHRISQAVLASVLNTSLSTVRQWEIGAKHPSGPSRKLLHILDRKGIEALV